MANNKLENTKEKIISVANNLFSRFGFHKTSMDEIARVSRKAKGSLYYHFESKEVLFREVVQMELLHLKKALNKILENKKMQADEKLRTYFVTRMAILNTSNNYHEMLRADLYEHFDFVDDIRKEQTLWEREQLKMILTEGVDTAMFSAETSVDVMADVFQMVEKSMEIPFFIQEKYEYYAPYFDQLARIFLKGMK